MSWRGVFTGALALIALQTVVSTSAAAGRVGGMLTAVGGFVEDALSPAVPGIPDLSVSSDSSSSTSSTGTTVNA